MPGNAWPVSGSRTAVRVEEKSPARSAAVSGKAAVDSDPGRTRRLSHEPKMNSLSLRMGPPAVAPNWFWINCGFTDGAKKFRAFSLWLRRNSQAVACRSLVPERVTTLKIDPALRPYSAVKLLLSTLTSRSASGGG